jgi:uncharacterized membrane protein YfcA
LARAVGKAQANILIAPLTAVRSAPAPGFNLPISLPATALFVVNDSWYAGADRRCAGRCALSCVAALPLPALFVAPVAARWSARAPVSVLRRLFAVCLVAIAVRLLLRA